MTEAVVWEGAEQLRGDLVPIASLTLHPDNPRIGDVEEIAKSLKRWGQVRYVLTDEDGTVVAGNHTLLAAESLGWTHIARVVNSFADEAAARRYLLADNRLTDLGEYDRAEHLLLIAELEQSGAWEGTGYTQDDLDHYRALEAAAAAPPPAPPEPPPAADPPATPGIRERVLLFTEDQYADFGQHIRALRERYGVEGVTETIVRAVHDEALAANQAPA